MLHLQGLLYFSVNSFSYNAQGTYELSKKVHSKLKCYYATDDVDEGLTKLSLPMTGGKPQFTYFPSTLSPKGICFLQRTEKAFGLEIIHQRNTKVTHCQYLHDYKNKHNILFDIKEKENKLFEIKYFLRDFKMRFFFNVMFQNHLRLLPRFV